MTMRVNEQAAGRRDALRPVRLWVPDTRRPGFAQECERQCRLAAKVDQTDTAIQELMDDALSDIDGWTN